MRTVIFLLLALLGPSLGAQSLSDQMERLQGLISPEVTIGRDKVRQALSYDPAQPYQITFQVTEINRRGRSDKVEYRANLALMDPSKAEWRDGGDQIKVNLESQGEASIKVYEEGELDDYEDEMIIQAIDIDNARALTELLLELLPQAREQWKADNALPEGYPALKAWVADHVGRTDGGDEQYQQTWAADPESEHRVVFTQVEIDGSDETERVYRFDLADLNPNDIELQVKGTIVEIELNTKGKREYIQVVEDGYLDDYERDCTIYSDELDEAQLLREVLSQLPRLAEEAAQPLPSPTTRTSAQSSLQAAVESFSYGEYRVEQELTGNCAARYRVELTTDGDTESNTYAFDFSDLNPVSAEIEVKRSDLLVTVETREKRDYIYHSEDGEQENYEDEVSFYAPDVPAAKRMLHFLKLTIDACPSAVKPVRWETLQRKVEDGSNEEVRQTIAQMDGLCKWSFTLREDDEENRYEFNLYDLDPREVELKVRRKEIEIELRTLDQAEIIKTFTDGEEQGYERDFDMQMQDLPSAKAVQVTLIEMIEACIQE
jgi:HSP20 family molecular chaperone IbpA